MKLVGNDAWYLDLDIDAVKESWKEIPDYTTKEHAPARAGLVQPHRPISTALATASLILLMVAPQVFCLNGLDRSKFIHLDFLDFAVAVLEGHINIGSINAIRAPLMLLSPWRSPMIGSHTTLYHTAGR